MGTEADNCRKYLVPKLIEAGWDDEPHSIAEQRTFTDGRIVVMGKKVRRKKKKRADYVVDNTGDIAKTRDQVLGILRELESRVERGDSQHRAGKESG